MKRSALLLAALLCLAPRGSAGQAPPSAPPADPNIGAAHHYFTDVELLDQDGRKLRLYSDLLQGKVVIINSFFATCEAVCPVISAKMAQIQAHLGARLGKEVVMLSFTVDPAHDTPTVLKAYAARWNAKPGWYFLTGPPENLKFALQKLGQWVENKDAHMTLLIIGNEPTGLWKKANAVGKPEELIAVVDSVLRDEV